MRKLCKVRKVLGHAGLGADCGGGGRDGGGKDDGLVVSGVIS